MDVVLITVEGIFASSLNGKNRRNNRITRSKFTGLCETLQGSWNVRLKVIRVGRYCDELHAAWAYNVAAFEEYGKEAEFNNMDMPEGWIDSNPAFKRKCLPRGVRSHYSKYRAHIRRDGVNKYFGMFGTLEEASAAYGAADAAHEAKKRELHEAKEITKDISGAYVMCGTEKVYVSDCDWHNLSRHPWSLNTNGYPQACIGEVPTPMH